ncbi:hypothetical protein QVD17_17851 [Tagetes erecta]|uniref:SHSP domain-containing protein n=1 Tax=Tagetes erecta TaxID=13708 RepID=A0AAD8NV95_TARER|nr:hypothetical protein QVD17_17851 [Tagetes erecta]
MESKQQQQQQAARVYQDFEPSMEWVPEDDSDTLLLFLPGFAKEQLRVQLRARNLMISGERNLRQNTWSRFRVEFPVSGNCDLNKISAKFEGNILFVRQPKLITPAPKPAQDPNPYKPAAKPEEPNPAEVSPVPTPQKQPEDDESNSATQQVPPKIQDQKKQEKGKLGVDVCENTTSDVSAASTEWDEKKNKNLVYKTGGDKYKRAAAEFAMKLKTSCNTIVVVALGLVVGLYVSDSLIKSWPEP